MPNKDSAGYYAVQHCMHVKRGHDNKKNGKNYMSAQPQRKTNPIYSGVHVVLSGKSLLHSRRRRSVNFRGHNIFARQICVKHLPQKINKKLKN